MNPVMIDGVERFRDILIDSPNYAVCLRGDKKKITKMQDDGLQVYLTTDPRMIAAHKLIEKMEV